jgi:hypothetical protein
MLEKDQGLLARTVGDGGKTSSAANKSSDAKNGCLNGIVKP